MIAAREWGACDMIPPCPSTAPTLIPAGFQLGAAAQQSLSTELLLQLSWIRSNWNRRGLVSPNSVSLEQRIIEHRFEYHTPRVLNQIDGDHFGLLVRVLLGRLREGKFLERIEGRLPKIVDDPIKFHRRYYGKWIKANSKWLQLDKSELCQALFRFLFSLLSTDKEKTELSPADPKRRKMCDAGWQSFHISEDELESLVRKVVTQYFDDAWELAPWRLAP